MLVFLFYVFVGFFSQITNFVEVKEVPDKSLIIYTIERILR